MRRPTALVSTQAGLIYLVLTFTLVGLFKLAENHWLAYLKPRGH